MGSTEVIEGERVEDVGLEETVYVAVGKNIEKSQQLLHWALDNCAKKKICVLHVHRPERIYSLNAKPNGIEPEGNKIKAFQEQERQQVHELLDQYLLTLTLEGVEANKMLIEMDSIEKGIEHAIAQHNIRWLVMGAAGEGYQSGKLADEETKKAVLVLEQASVPCNIWFIYKGNLICTSADCKHISEIETSPSLLVISSNTGGKKSKINSECTANSQKYLDAENMEGMLRNFSCHCSIESTQSSTMLTDLLSLKEESDVHNDAREQGERLELANVDATSFKTKEPIGVEESSSVEDDNTMEAEALESLCAIEISRRRELEELLAQEKYELLKLKDQQDETMVELRMIQDQNSALNSQVVDSRAMVTELEEKILSAVELLISFKEKRDKLRIEHANAVREVNKLKFVNADSEYPHEAEFPTFSFLEINEATNDFDPSWKIGEGRYGSVYKGLLHNMQVAVRMLPSYGCQGQLEFQHQVEVLSRVRHPNIVTLIGSCPETRSLVYDYLNNGSLEEHLARKDKTPLPWQIRISIAADICSALIFLHSSKPCIIHGNLKPSKILLDVNFVAKLCDLGISSLVQRSGHSADSNTTVNNRNESSVYVDTEFLITAKLVPESDVYSFGIILLQLLTGRPISGIVRDTKCALEKENLKAVLDISAGEWPLYQVEQLAYLALRCSEKTRMNRPDLVSEIWSVLGPLKTSCSNTSPYLTSKKLHRPPSHFVCPIFQEVMKDPFIAADGFTYEEDAIRGWLDSGHNTSPMTNLQLEHTNLVPNYALLNAIQEWQQLQ
ncbi:U-box domain-containing protein 32-like isoform X2 [Prosopis cineraria]|uniref:U-box domain-containing protein 32-like isoform X2 n=1 Tax=Prosopis cineraria TaxID=364024 RepID=UPI00240FC57D|nr:U-box domain-containing protein 32-like isoform X2 [Prosopis cineraria]